MRPLVIILLLTASRMFADGLQTIGSDFRFTEGPAADAAGNIYFTDLRVNRIYVHDTAGNISVFREDSGGANGLYFDHGGNLLICEGTNKRITSLAPDKTLVTLADEYNGKPFNKPNDLWVDSEGGIYFSDPVYGKVPKTQDGEHVYYITPDQSKVVRVIDDFVRPNGIIGTPDGKTLYVADHGDSRVWKYTINADGTLSNKTLFTKHASDGMTLDAQGNLFITENTVLVFNPAGEQIREIKTLDRPTNVTISGDTLYITARTHFCKIKIGKGD